MAKKKQVYSFQFCPYGKTISLFPGDYIVLSHFASHWICDPVKEVPDNISIMVFEELLKHNNLRWGKSAELLAHLNEKVNS